jgi:hypothetical protein
MMTEEASMAITEQEGPARTAAAKTMRAAVVEDWPITLSPPSTRSRPAVPSACTV